MSRPLKIWLASFAASCLIGLGIAFYDWRLAFGLAWTFFHSESATGFWMSRGLSPFNSTLIAILFSTVAVSNWFWLANQKLPASLQKLWNFSPQDKIRSGWTQKMPYLFLPFASMAPDGGVWFAIAFGKFFRLNKKASFLLINAGNVTKNIGWATFFSFLTHDFQIIASLILFSIAGILAYRVLRKKLRREN